MSKNSKIVYLFICVVFFIIFNFIVSENIIKYGDRLVENPILNILLIQNQGAAFNIFQGCKLFLITFSLFAIAGIIWYVIKHIKSIPVIELFFTGILLSGIFNNMYERIVYGYVRDFIKLNFIDFPVFNISDIFINIGVIGILFITAKNSYLTRAKK